MTHMPQDDQCHLWHKMTKAVCDKNWQMFYDNMEKIAYGTEF